MKYISDIFPKTLHSDIPVIDSYSILFHNGLHVHSNQPRQLPEGVIVDSMANAKLEGNGFYVFVPAGRKLSKPIQIIHLFDEHYHSSLPSRNLVIVEAGSSAELFISDFSLSDASDSSLQEKGRGEVYDQTKVTLGDAASLEMVRLQKMNSAILLSTETIVQQTASSRMKSNYITLGGASISTGLKVNLNGKQAEHTATGLSLTQQSENVNMDMLITHASPDCQSKQLFKNILSDKSTGAYTGRIVVNRDAQKTIAYQRSNNILLHPKAKMNILPQLEIYADDVKCSHGATVGQLDAEALFYLRSRGISETEAKKILLHAFAHEVFDGISGMSFREGILKLTEQKPVMGRIR